MLDDMPVLTFLANPVWDTYQTSTLTGFPNNNYPYYLTAQVATEPEILALNVHLN